MMGKTAKWIRDTEGRVSRAQDEKHAMYVQKAGIPHPLRQRHGIHWTLQWSRIHHKYVQTTATHEEVVEKLYSQAVTATLRKARHVWHKAACATRKGYYKEYWSRAEDLVQTIIEQSKAKKRLAGPSWGPAKKQQKTW